MTDFVESCPVRDRPVCSAWDVYRQTGCGVRALVRKRVTAVLCKDIVHIARTIFLCRAAAYQRLALRNHADRPVSLRLRLNFGSDFADRSRFAACGGRDAAAPALPSWRATRSC